MNLALGLGSYVQGDIPGGLIITSGFAAGFGMILYSANLPYARTISEYRTDHQNNVIAFCNYVGIPLSIATGVFSFIRPYIFNNKLAASFMSGVTIEPVSYGLDKTALKFGYTLNF